MQNTKTFRATLFHNTPEGEVFVGDVLVITDVDLNAGSSRYVLKDMVDILDQPLQRDTLSTASISSAARVDGYEGLDESIDLPNFDNLDEALAEFNSIAEKVESAEKKITAKENKGIKKLSERKYQKLKQRVKMNITISQKERQHYEEQKALRELFSIVST